MAKKSKRPRIGTFGALLKDAGIDKGEFKQKNSESKNSQVHNQSTKKSESDWKRVKKSTKPLRNGPNKVPEKSRGNSHKKTKNVKSIKPSKSKRKKPLKNKSGTWKKEKEQLLDLSVYDRNSKSKKTRDPEPIVDPIKIQIRGELSGNWPAFSKRDFHQIKKVDHAGIELDLPGDKNDENELVIGLDFGTSNTKVVIHDPQRNVFYAVPFFTIGSDDAYFLPCRIYLNNSQYSLDGKGTCFEDLKLPLINGNEDSGDLCHVVAFLSMVIRHARGWLLSEHTVTYEKTELLWALNIGVPTATYEENSLRKRFKQIGLAAMNLAGDSSELITEELVNRHIKTLEQAINNKITLQIHPDLVNVYPEIGAQVVAFIESEAWDDKNRPFITMIDIGAGTVDVSFFSVQRERGNRRFNFFSNSVVPNGTVNLHRQRTQWIDEQLKNKNFIKKNIEQFLKDISMTTHFRFIPESINDYILNLEILGKDSIDEVFFKQYKKQVTELLNRTRNKRIPRNDDNWKRLPVFICGGGSRMKFYKDVIESINKSLSSSSWLQLVLMTLYKPQNLRAEGLSKFDYDRLSVAYGLSFTDLGKIITSREIDDFSLHSLPIKERSVDLTNDG